MTDFFALLEEPRTAICDLDSLKSRFLERTAMVHPDRVHNAPLEEKQAAQLAYTSLNAAFETLRDPRKRLQHWLELETGKASNAVQIVPSSVMDITMQAGQIIREVDKHLAEQAAATSPMIKARLFGKSVEWQDRLTQLLAQFDDQISRTNRMAADFDHRWSTPLPLEALSLLAEIAHIYGYLGKWRGQVQDRQVKLAL